MNNFHNLEDSKPEISFPKITFLSKLDNFAQIFDIYPVYYFWICLKKNWGIFSEQKRTPYPPVKLGLFLRYIFWIGSRSPRKRKESWEKKGVGASMLCPGGRPEA